VRSARDTDWTDAEKETVRRLYPSDIDACVAALPRRTRGAVTRMAHALGAFYRSRRWTDLENARLRRMWHSYSVRQLAQRFGRSEWGVWEHARHIGLPLGVPRGCEYFTEACERTGFHGRSLWRIIRWAEVVTTATPVKPGALNRQRRYYVDPFDVDEAVKKWLATETIDAAARRHGVAGNTMRYWLKRAGLLHPRGPKSSLHHRIESVVIDRVVSEWRAQKVAA
jgi:hypothetical protein